MSKPLCCANPDLDFHWRLGYEDETETTHVLLIENVYCKNCESTYAFDTRNDESSPLVALYEGLGDRNLAASLRVDFVKPKVS